MAKKADDARDDGYRVVLPGDVFQEGCRHAAHAMIYAKLKDKLFGRYEMNYGILMQLRFDGALGFTGGIIDEGETPEEACSRECCEELGVAPTDLVITPSNHIATHYSTHTNFCLHFYAKEVSLELLEKFERKTPFAKDWGQEVLGVIRCPLYTLPNGMGLPTFLAHRFIGNARTQLLLGIKRRGLLSEDALQKAIDQSKVVDCLVTVGNTDY